MPLPGEGASTSLLLKLSHGPISYPVKKISQKESPDYWTFVQPT
jgi:hypothetical protein